MRGTRQLVAATAVLVIAALALVGVIAHEPGSSITVGEQAAAAAGGGAERTDRGGGSDPVPTAPAAGPVAGSLALWRFLAGPVDSDTSAFAERWRDAFDTRSPTATQAAAEAAARLATTLDGLRTGLERAEWPDGGADAARRLADAAGSEADALRSFASPASSGDVTGASASFLDVKRREDERRGRAEILTAALGAPAAAQ